jgi:hypothetical protein
VGLDELCKVEDADTDRVAHAKVRELTVFAEVVDGRGAHAEELGDLADRNQGFPRTFSRKTI